MTRVVLNSPRLVLTYSHRPPGGLGRFGGGWEWQIGVKVSRGARTIILDLGVASLRIQRGRRR